MTNESIVARDVEEDEWASKNSSRSLHITYVTFKASPTVPAVLLINAEKLRYIHLPFRQLDLLFQMTDCV